ncbi:helix-turn-helix domain-containing protein [Microvirga aerilata]|nr:helix-turn-helix domain-containing protein [Microvirga aerilata]
MAQLGDRNEKKQQGQNMQTGLFERLIISLGSIPAETNDKLSLDGDLRRPSVIDAAVVRSRTGLSQAAFARCVGVAIGTIRNWEQGRRTPQGPARALLARLDRIPRLVEQTLKT